MDFNKEKGTEQITQFAIENWWISDYTSLFTLSTSSFYIQAIEDCEIMILEAPSIDPLFEDAPLLERYFRLVILRPYAAARLRIKFLYGFLREALYYHFSSRFPEFVQRVPHYMLASYLGFTSAYLSEMRNKR